MAETAEAALKDEIIGAELGQATYVGYLIGGALVGLVIGLIPVVGIIVGIVTLVVTYKYAKKGTHKIFGYGIGVVAIITSLGTTLTGASLKNLGLSALDVKAKAGWMWPALYPSQLFVEKVGDLFKKNGTSGTPPADTGGETVVTPPPVDGTTGEDVPTFVQTYTL